MPLPRFFKKHTTGLLAIGLVAACLLLFYAWFETAAKRIVEHYEIQPTLRNSVKHAYTAASLYTVLRKIGVEPDMAKQSIIGLGRANEWSEIYIKFSSDTEHEMRKDLTNNFMGVRAAEWRLAQVEKPDLAPLIAALAKQGSLMHWSRIKYPVDKESRPAKLRTAIQWLEDNREGLDIHAKTALSTLPPYVKKN